MYPFNIHDRAHTGDEVSSEACEGMVSLQGENQGLTLGSAPKAAPQNLSLSKYNFLFL